MRDSRLLNFCTLWQMRSEAEEQTKQRQNKKKSMFWNTQQALEIWMGWNVSDAGSSGNFNDIYVHLLN